MRAAAMIARGQLDPARWPVGYTALRWEERARAVCAAGSDGAIGEEDPPAEFAELFASLLRHSVEGIVLSSGQSRRIVEVSESFCTLSGYTRRELLGRTSLQLGLVSEGERSEPARAADARAEGLHDRELRREDGELRAVELSHQLLPGDELVLTIVRDVSARSHVEQALRVARSSAERANRAKNVFLSRMSHELRTPLNAILGFSQLLELGGPRADQRESVELIGVSGNLLLELINDVLDFAQIEAGELRLSLETLSVVERVNEALQVIRPLADERGIRLIADWPTATGGPHVSADRRRLGQILRNLLSNAVKYNVPGGSVTITCMSTHDEMVRIAVTDTGPGVAPDKLPLLFTSFERLGAEARDIEGTGLGLALSKSLAEAMGGRLLVDTTVGSGSTFTLALPAATPEPHAPPQPGGRDGQWPTNAKPAGTVVYIEDSPPNVLLVRAILRLRPNITLLSATTAADGVRLARERAPDLVLLDLQLPDASGESVLQQLLLDPLTAAVPVVITSADVTPGQVQRLIAAGAHDYATKPMDVRWLLGLVDRLLIPADAE